MLPAEWVAKTVSNYEIIIDSLIGEYDAGDCLSVLAKYKVVG